jgi:hypothetical protein
MTRNWLATACALLLGCSHAVAGPQTYTPVNAAPYAWQSLGYSQFSFSSTTVVNLAGVGGTQTAGTLAAIPSVCSQSGSGCCASISVETASIRWRDDGTAPTASIGNPVTYFTAGTPFQPYLYCGDTLANVQIIALSGTPVVNVEFLH